MYYSVYCLFFFFFNDTATTEIYTLSLHDALPIFVNARGACRWATQVTQVDHRAVDRKSTRLNSSHGSISYAVFCLKKKKNPQRRSRQSREMTVRRGGDSSGRCT